MYRIIEERTTVTKQSKFYIQKRKSFLWWTWWDKLTTYYWRYEMEIVHGYDSYESAKEDLDKFNDKIEVIIY